MIFVSKFFQVFDRKVEIEENLMTHIGTANNKNAILAFLGRKKRQYI